MLPAVRFGDMDLPKVRVVLESVIELTESPLAEGPEILGLGLPGQPLETLLLQFSSAKWTGDGCPACLSGG